jgi:glycosyltransferase involved in cell wall biosynthesis
VGTSSAILQQGLDAGIRSRRTGVVGNPYNDRAFQPPAVRRNSQDRLIVGFAGVFGERKGVLELCRAYTELSNRLRRTGGQRSELHLVGGGREDYVRQMKTALADGGVLDETRFLGHRQTAEEMCEFFQSLDLYVMLSKREGMSVAMMEAMASGAPAAILSPWGDDAVIDGKTGIRLPADDPQTVVDKLWPFVVDSEARERLASAAVIHLREQFAPAAVARKLEAIYEDTLAGR